MLQPRRGLDLGEESLGAECRAEVLVEKLDGDVAIVSLVAREEDGRHPALADLALDVVAARERGGEGGVWTRRRERRTHRVR